MDGVERDHVPIAMINALAYCPRRFFYECVQGEMLVNAHVLEGEQLHENVDMGDVRVWTEGAVQHRRVYVWSERLRLVGFCDVVEERNGVLSLVEYKKGKPRRWRNDHAQLCAQAMCLEERLGCSIQQGAIFYFSVRRREEVVFTPQLRAEVELLVEQAHALMRSEQLPAPITHRAKCKDCSLEPICLPDEVLLLKGSALQGEVWNC